LRAGWFRRFEKRVIELFHDPFASGSMVTSSIRLVRKLGEGGMGSVWVAEHLTLHTQVAVKFMTEQVAASPDAAMRFTREARAAAQLRSAHVVQIFDHGVLEGGIPYIVMELLEGESLATHLGLRGRLSPTVVVQIVTQTCRALAKAHERGVIHRDIKPDNIFLVDPDGDLFVKLLDFGVAKRMQEDVSVTATGAMVGTPNYMSPEQMLSAKHVDARADLWALAVVAYQCVTGSLPFAGETFGAIAVAVAQGDFAAPFRVRGCGSPALDAWFERALARDRDQRFTSAHELARAFARAAEAAPPPTPPSGGSVSPDSLTRTFPLPRTTPDTAEAASARASSKPPKTFVGFSTTMAGAHGRKRYTKIAALLALVGILGVGSVAISPMIRGVSSKREPLPGVGSATVNGVPTTLVGIRSSAAPTPNGEARLAPIITALDIAPPTAASVPTHRSPRPNAKLRVPTPARKVAREAPRATAEPTPDAAPTRTDRGF
jgi:serine/threonine protein kinase